MIKVAFEFPELLLSYRKFEQSMQKYPTKFHISS